MRATVLQLVMVCAATALLLLGREGADAYIAASFVIWALKPEIGK